ncbi:hypothetical protein KSX_59810 [Ktedonospora formicarum]|uniref:Uncharacterized protein n=1 Tax=Ktedonospora formicarum TaxID=2778364 RepID=A0A8J3MVM5_9CHLR|nr:hypothetical protein KSX_59810 [Ktedonospora formicarum]
MNLLCVPNIDLKRSKEKEQAMYEADREHTSKAAYSIGLTFRASQKATCDLVVAV